MPSKKKKGSVIAVCIQEPFEDGSVMDFGAIQGANLKFLHQAFISDTVATALKVSKADDIRLYFIGTARLFPTRQGTELIVFARKATDFVPII